MTTFFRNRNNTWFRRIFGPTKRQLHQLASHLSNENSRLTSEVTHLRAANGVYYNEVQALNRELNQVRLDYMHARAHLMAVRVQDAAPRIGWEVSAFITSDTIVRLKKMSASGVDNFITTVARVLVESAIKGILRLREARPSALIFAPASARAPANQPRLITAVIPKQHGGGFKIFGASHTIVGRQDELAVVASSHVEFTTLKQLVEKTDEHDEDTTDQSNQITDGGR